MESIYINGLGLVMGDLSDFTNLITVITERNGLLPEKVDNIPKESNMVALRKADRFSNMAVVSSVRALKEADITSTEQVGTIFNSVFGPLNTNIKFAQYVVDRDIEGASPTLFTNTVNNACVGYVCMALGCQGVSTMLLSSNYIGYAMQLIRTNKAHTILAGGVEEYSENVYQSMIEKGHNVVEGASVLVLEAEKNSNTYCEILAYHEAFIDAHPYYGSKHQSYEKCIEHIINRVLEKVHITKNKVEAVIQGAPALFEDETKVFDRLFTTENCYFNSIRSDALGASLGINLGIASALIRQKEYSVTLVTNLDYTGVYRVYLLGKA